MIAINYENSYHPAVMTKSGIKQQFFVFMTKYEDIRPC
jgi:hypothetical protein